MSQSPSVHFHTLGCPKNEADARAMSAAASSAGYRVVHDPEAADAVVVNTCSFISAATEESIDAVLELAHEWKTPGRRLVVAGCMPSRYRDSLAPELPEVDAFVPVDREGAIAEVLESLLGPGAGPATSATATGVSAYLNVCDGCDRTCTFCTIPSIRGPFTSRTSGDVLAEARALVTAGARELVLVGQDVSAYGRGSGEDLAGLVGSLDAESGADWIRLMYLQPEGVTDTLLAAMSRCRSVCAYLDIPLQHVSRSVLRAMGRAGDAASFLDLVARVRDLMPEVSLRTTLIAGFPGETDDDVDELLAFLDEAALDYVGVFPYSPEEGTAAADLPGRIDPDTVRARAQRIRDAADLAAFPSLTRHVGSTLDVLVEGTDEEGVVGRWEGQAPEIDGVVHLSGDAEPGEIVRATVEEAVAYDLLARIER